MSRPLNKPENPLDTPLQEDVERILDKRRRKDMKDMIQIIMNSPIKNDGSEIVTPDGSLSLSDLKGKNITVMTGIIVAHAVQAAQGDTKSFDLLGKYGGYTPVVEQHVTMDVPKIIDDVTENRPIPIYDREGNIVGYQDEEAKEPESE